MVCEELHLSPVRLRAESAQSLGIKNLQTPQGGGGKDGIGIASVEQIQTSTESEGVNILKVILTNGEFALFEVRNGAKGERGNDGVDGVDGTDGHTPVITSQTISGGVQILSDGVVIGTIPVGGNGVATPIEDNLTSDRSDAALSAKQGKILKTEIDTLGSKVGSSETNIMINELTENSFVWDGSKFAQTSGYVTYVIELTNGRKYKTGSGAYSTRLFSEKPVLNGSGGVMTQSKDNAEIVGSETNKYLTIAFTKASQYIATYKLLAYAGGLEKDVSDAKIAIENINQAEQTTSEKVAEIQDLISGDIKPRIETALTVGSDQSLKGTIMVSGNAGSIINFEFSDVPASITGKLARLFYYDKSNQLIAIDYYNIANGSKYRIVAPDVFTKLYFYQKNTTYVIGETCNVTTWIGDDKESLPKRVDGLANDIEEIREEIDGVSKKPLYGKKIVCFGDSVTEGYINNVGGKTYPDLIAEITGATVVNCGIGGTRLKVRTAYKTIEEINTLKSQGDNSYKSYVISRVDIPNAIRAVIGNSKSGLTSQEWVSYDEGVTFAMGDASVGLSMTIGNVRSRTRNVNLNDVDIVTIAGGTNDWTGGVANPSEALVECVNELLNNYPHLTVIVFTPIIRWQANPKTDANSSDVWSVGKTLRAYAKDIYDACVNNHIIVCDAYNTLGINTSNADHYFGNDLTHPKDYSRMGSKYSAFICANFL